MKKILPLLMVVLLGSCTMQKRMYRPGFMIDWSHKQDKNSPHKSLADDEYYISEAEIVDAAIPEPETEQELTYAEDNATAALGDETPAKWVNPALTILPEDCDNIILSNGDEIAAKVTQITADKVMYVKCNDPTGGTFFAEKSVVFMIKYADGTKKVFGKKPKQDYYGEEDARTALDESDTASKNKNGIFGILSFVLAILGLLILAVPFGLLAVIFGFVGLTRSRKGLAIAGIIIGIVDVIIGLIIIASVV